MGTVLEVANVVARPGELKLGSIPVIELQDSTKVDLPVIILNGEKDGPTLLLTAAVHGTEIPGIQVIQRITRQEVNPKDLHGAIIAIPVANPFAFQHCLYYTLQDDTGLHNIPFFPGNPTGRQTERIAYAILTEAISKADYAIDIHANPMPSIPFVILSRKYAKDKDTLEKAEEMAEAFGVTIIEERGRDPLPPPGGMTSCCMANGIPSLLVELADARHLDTHDGVEVGVRGILNVLKSLGMLMGEIEKQTGVKIIEGQQVVRGVITPNRGGLAHFEVEPGEKISKGTIIARIVNVYGDDVEAVKMPIDGYIWAFICGFHGHYQAVSTGDNLCYICSPSK